MKGICKVLLAAAAIAALAAPAIAADKLIVKDAAGTNTVFKVTDTGAATIGTGTVATPSKLDVSESLTVSTANQTTPVTAAYNNNVQRTKLRIDGVQEWYLNGGTSEVGRIAYTTPGGGVGFGLFTGATYDQNKYMLVNYGNNGMGVAAFVMQYGATANSYIAQTLTGVSIGTSWNPRAELEVTGTLMINDTPSDGGGWKTTKPVCDATKDGGLYYTVGAAGVASKLELCQKAAAGTYSWVLVK